jgi:hypothetical protein
MSEDPKPETEPIFLPGIRGLARGTCALVSLAGLAAGGFAVFKTDNEFGTTGLLLIGALAGITALIQRIPKIKWATTNSTLVSPCESRRRLATGWPM